jgi:hypothetical protein
VTSRAAPTNVISKQLAFRYCIALKKNRDALLILGHHRRLPTPSTPLIQKIGEGVFILSCVARELDYHSLVFFHQELDYEPVSVHYAEAGRMGLK